MSAHSATAKELFGSHTFQAVVLQKRPDHWDNSRVPNVKIVRAGGKFLLHCINFATRQRPAQAPPPAVPLDYRMRSISAFSGIPLVKCTVAGRIERRLRGVEGAQGGFEPRALFRPPAVSLIGQRRLV